MKSSKKRPLSQWSTANQYSSLFNPIIEHVKAVQSPTLTSLARSSKSACQQRAKDASCENDNSDLSIRAKDASGSKDACGSKDASGSKASIATVLLSKPQIVSRRGRPHQPGEQTLSEPAVVSSEQWPLMECGESDENGRVERPHSAVERQSVDETKAQKAPAGVQAQFRVSGLRRRGIRPPTVPIV